MGNKLKTQGVPKMISELILINASIAIIFILIKGLMDLEITGKQLKKPLAISIANLIIILIIFGIYYRSIFLSQYRYFYQIGHLVYFSYQFFYIFTFDEFLIISYFTLLLLSLTNKTGKLNLMKKYHITRDEVNKLNPFNKKKLVREWSEWNKNK